MSRMQTFGLKSLTAPTTPAPLVSVRTTWPSSSSRMRKVITVSKESSATRTRKGEKAVPFCMSVTPSSCLRQRGVGESEAIHHVMQQCPNEAQLAHRADALERGAVEGRDQELAYRFDRRLARQRAAADEAHLAEELAGADDVQQPSSLGDLGLALGEEVETVAPLAFADDHLVGVDAVPMRCLGERPQLRLAERA